jgi:hypothetical protein
VENCFAGAAETLHQTDYADACPIATVALEVASTNEALRGATAEVFESWITSATKRFVAGGIRHGTARALAITTITSLEGAFVLSRAMRSTEPLEAAGAAVAVATQAALLSAA